MSSLYTNLLFMHGHIADPALARRLADAPKAAPRPRGKREPSRPAWLFAPLRKALPAAPLAQSGCGCG